jgi:hypothetical protein
MRRYYFIGGPTEGHQEEFFRRLDNVGGSPPGWRIYPHAAGDGQALHIVETDGEESILAHLAKLEPHYRHGPIVELHPPVTH